MGCEVAALDNPILNSPFLPPGQHWALDEFGVPPRHDGGVGGAGTASSFYALVNNDLSERVIGLAINVHRELGQRRNC